MYTEVCEIIKGYQKEAAEVVDKNSNGKMHDTHFKIMTRHVGIVDEYLEKVKKKMRFYQTKEITKENKLAYKVVIKEIYNIVGTTIYSEEKVKGVN